MGADIASLQQQVNSLNENVIKVLNPMVSEPNYQFLLTD